MVLSLSMAKSESGESRAWSVERLRRTESREEEEWTWPTSEVGPRLGHDVSAGSSQQNSPELSFLIATWKCKSQKPQKNLENIGHGWTRALGLQPLSSWQLLESTHRGRNDEAAARRSDFCQRPATDRGAMAGNNALAMVWFQIFES